MRKYIVKTGSVARAVFDSLDEAKEPALEMIRQGQDAYIDQMVEGTSPPTPVITFNYDPERGDWIETNSCTLGR